MNEKKFARKIERGHEPAPEEYKPMTEEEKERRKEIRKKLVGAINEVLRKDKPKEDKFEKQSSTWRREAKDVDGKEVVQVVNLQRSDPAFWYFLNIGVFIKEFDPNNKKPHAHECHKNERFEYINEENKDNEEEYQEQAREKRRILDFEDTSDADVEEKIVKTKEIIENEILPFFADFNVDKFIEEEKAKRK